MASVSKDGTWKLWDTDVEYKKQQDPYLLRTGCFEAASTTPCRLALSPDAQVLALASGSSIHLYNTRRPLIPSSLWESSGPPLLAWGSSSLLFKETKAQ